MFFHRSLDRSRCGYLITRKAAFSRVHDHYSPVVMISASERYVIACNGEIYNYLDRRAELERAGSEFRGHSDTEMLLAAVERSLILA